jgi:hypothetical protein
MLGFQEAEPHVLLFSKLLKRDKKALKIFPTSSEKTTVRVFLLKHLHRAEKTTR